ncbi:Crp/Fnr family transcriptional regulator [Chitinophaga sp. 30R24]|uniref:Crp/Fnr family transcriptional regulator n=1 Tax=Chitinophaga sp. 30R24 TaxID=3248838 RepID=UPI003B90567C
MLSIAETGLYNYLVQKNVPGLKDNVTTLSLKRGAQLYGTSQRFTDIYEIVTGAVKLGSISDKGKEFIYELVTPGEFFGNLAVLKQDDFCEFCKALVITQLRSYKLPFFKHVTTHDPEVAGWCFAKIVSRWNKTESILANIRSYEPRERIQVLNTELQNTKIAAANRLISLGSLVTYQDIADLTATTRQLAADTLNVL